MPATGTLGLYPRFYGHDLDGNPLGGGKLHSFLSGTSTPLALYTDAALTTEHPNPLILDASGEATYYYGPATYGLTLTDAQDVPLWTIDPVLGTGGGLAQAGIGVGSNTVEVRPGIGQAQVTVSVFPGAVLAMGLTVWCPEALGTSQGLTTLGIGTVERPDCWGLVPTMTLDQQSNAGLFLSYSGQPQPTSGAVTLTAYGGVFDGSGALYVTGHFLTFHPSHALGLTYVPPTPQGGEPPVMPYATETSPGAVELLDATEVLSDTDLTRALTIGRLVSRTATETRLGLIELATSVEVIAGTDPTRAVTPAGLAARIASGTALSVARYASSGTSLETAPLTTLATGEVGVNGAAVTGTALTVTGALNATNGAQTRTNLGLGTASDVQHARLGLGQAPSPAARLVFTSEQAQKILLYADGVNARYGLGVAAGVHQVFVPATGRVDLGGINTTDGTTFTPVLTAQASTGRVGVNNITAPTAPLDINGDTLRLRTAKTPASATAAGNAGDLAWDSSGIYVCIATNTWRKATLGTF